MAAWAKLTDLSPSCSTLHCKNVVWPTRAVTFRETSKLKYGCNDMLCSGYTVSLATASTTSASNKSNTNTCNECYNLVHYVCVCGGGRGGGVRLLPHILSICNRFQWLELSDNRSRATLVNSKLMNNGCNKSNNNRKQPPATDKHLLTKTAAPNACHTWSAVSIVDFVFANPLRMGCVRKFGCGLCGIRFVYFIEPTTNSRRH